MSSPEINPKTTQMNRRTFLKRTLATIGGMLVFSIPTYAYTGERHWIEITNHTIASPRIPKSFNGVRMIHISDLHYGHYLDETHLAKIVEQMNALQPDVVCFTGDFIDQQLSLQDAEKVRSVLTRLSARLGKYAILGNHDYWGDEHLVTKTLKESGFQVLVNATTTVQIQNEFIRISGLDDLLEGSPDMNQIKSAFKEDQFHIMLMHEPDFADHISQYAVDLQLSGHSHGGQIRIPFMGAPLTPEYSRKYKSGLYQNINRSKLTLYTNRGLGTTILPLRFSCRPEIAVLQLQQQL
ncbi:metallophosphoesterase [Hazenella sp. IB182353]|uniref:metallophosphoesterase n=1 Tax=Polycladospora coralii TaxID=2771432 RepID=UPI001746EA1F|nr:metallophosphoesterase [Polycladospora coralii]MBS7531692.1 metallophosphoesterase [Polycladospora coralii]